MAQIGSLESIDGCTNAANFFQAWFNRPRASIAQGEATLTRAQQAKQHDRT
jgi:hypothetical protein